MEQLKLTPIDELEDMADGVPVLAVEGTVKYAADITRGVAKASGKEWTKQFFVLGSDTADIACSMWDAEGSEVSKGEHIRIENTQNKKGQWNGMLKGSYQKDGERKHTLEIRANQVKITAPGGGENNAKPKPGSSGEPSQDLGYDPDEQRDKPLLDSRQRAIIRQHSQSMSLEVLKLKASLNELTVVDLTPAKLTMLADYFDADVLGAAQ